MMNWVKLVTLLLINKCLTISLASPPSYSLFPINEGPGIFYHQIGTAKISNDHFKLITFVNMSIIESKLTLLKSLHAKSLNICSQHKFDSSNQRFGCIQSLRTQEIDAMRLTEKFDAINHLTGHQREPIYPRMKRGIINGVSYAFKWLFGTPDADDAQYYSDAINAIKNQNHDVQILMKHQIHIMSDAISDYNKSAQALKLNEEKLNDNIQKFNEFSNSTMKLINSVNYFQATREHFFNVFKLVNELDEDIDTLTSAILFSKQNIIHPIIITPLHLRQELLRLKLKTNIEFPINLEDIDEVYKFLNICQLSVIFHDKLLIFSIKVPISTRELYQLFNLIPLPIQLPNITIYSFIEPNYPYLLLSTTRTLYGQMNDMSSCQQLSTSSYLCHKVITYRSQERPTCETKLKLALISKIPEDCKTKTIKSEMEIWHQLSNNEWLYILSKPSIGTINCEEGPKQMEDIEFIGTGILKMQPRCKCYTVATILSSTTNYSSVANYTNYIPHLNINEDDCCIKEQIFLQREEMEPIKLHDINLNELRHAKAKLEQFDQILQSNINKPFILQHSRWYNILFGIISMIVGILMFYLTCCKCCNCRYLIRKIRKWFDDNNCGNPICINSHNSVSASSLNLHNIRLSDLQRTREDINSPRNSIQEDITDVLKEMSLPRRSKRTIKM